MNFLIEMFFATVQEEIGRLDPFQEAKETGSMGRLMDVLDVKGYNVNAFSLDTPLTMLQGRIDHEAKSAVQSLHGFEQYNPSSPDGVVTQTTSLLNGETEKGNSLYSNIWSSSLVSNMRQKYSTFSHLKSF